MPANAAIADPLRQLDGRLIDMGSLVESLFVGSVVALIDKSQEGMPELREEDCRAHERCIEIEKLGTAILTNEGLQIERVRLVLATIKIASALKRAADEALHIAEGLRSCGGEELMDSHMPAALPRMTAIVQTMLSEAVASVVEKRASAAQAMHASMRELAELNEEALQQLVSMAASDGGGPAGAFLRAAQHLERIGHEALDVATQVRHIYVPNHD